MVLDELQVLHSVALDVEGTGDQVNNSHGNAQVAGGHTNLPTVADVGEERLDDQKDAELKEVPWKAHHLQDVGVHHHRTHQAHNQGDPIGKSDHAPRVGKGAIAIHPVGVLIRILEVAIRPLQLQGGEVPISRREGQRKASENRKT